MSDPRLLTTDGPAVVVTSTAATEIHGTVHPDFAPVRDTFADHLAQGLEVGASVCVIADGEMVVDLWAGTADAAGTRPWERDTISVVWSSTKTMTALVALLLADRGELDLYAPVARYWPEFAANGKEGVLVRHVMSHTAGLPGWELPITNEQLYDLPLATSRLAAQAPWWEPGSACGYHAISQGHLMGEIVRRVTGTSLGTVFRTELAEPLGADFHIGTGPEHDPRIAEIVPPLTALGGSVEVPPDSLTARALLNPIVHATVSRDPALRRAELPASNGHGNARAMATVQQIVSHGGEANGRRFLSAATLERIFEVQAAGTDVVQGTPIRHGIGFGINGPEIPLGPNQRTCYWGGWGGSLVINDLDARMTFAYSMNRMNSGPAIDLRGPMLAIAAHRASAARSH